MNQNKQSKRICDDAELDDFDVTIKNNDENCLIKCSSGFYYQVVGPCFAALDVHSVLNYSNVAITVTEVQPSLDLNRYEYGRRMRFVFMTHNENLGGVVIHLHHSTRTVQIQGSGNVDQSKSAVWFTKFVVARFEEQARVKQYQIKNTNNMFRLGLSNQNLSNTNNINVCHHCNSIYNAQSKPTLCEACSS